MKQKICVLLCVFQILLLTSACNSNQTTMPDNDNIGEVTESTDQSALTTEESIPPTEERKAVDILEEAGLSHEKIVLYLSISSIVEYPMDAYDFLKIAEQPNELIRAYFLSVYSRYTIDEYIQVVADMESATFTDEQISNYSVFVNKYTSDEYIDLIKHMRDTGLTEHQINSYSEYSEISPETYINLSVNLESAVDALYNYSYFAEACSLEEYCELLTKPDTATGEESLLPLCPLSDDLIFAKRHISTYDYVEESIAILDMEGNIIRGWDPEWGEYDIQYRAKCGDYFFITTKGYAYDYYDCDVVNKAGEVIANIYCKAKKYDIGEGYVFFSLGADWGQIMNPRGEVIELQPGVDWPSYGDASGTLRDGEAIGKLSEGLFYGLCTKRSAAVYYNTNGEVAIDLSKEVRNFEVTQMSDFSDGQARIEFTGADYRDYYAFIDKAGAFIGEPVEITD